MVRFTRLGALSQNAQKSLGTLKNSVSPRGMLARFRYSEDGSMTVFTLFIFVMMLMVGGMAVDLMRFETNRTRLQNTLDAAALAATNMNSTSDPTMLVKDIMAKTGYDPNLVTVNPSEVRVGADPANGVQGELIARSVSASYDLNVDTLFMGFLGIDNLGTASAGAASEGTQAVEISLVLDISGSMEGDKLDALKVAANNFFTQVINPQRTEAVTSISIVPYNHAVVVPEVLLDELNDGGMVPIADNQQHRLPGRLTEFPRTAANSQCVIFPNSQMVTGDLEELVPVAADPNFLTMRRISPSTTLDKMAYYDRYAKSAGAGGSYDRPADDYNRRCDPTRAAILPFGTNIQELTDYVNALTAGGNTAVDVGLKWGVALLDPAFRPVIDELVDDGELPQSVAGRPIDYDRASTMKVVVLMTDGANTEQFDLQGSKKTGPTRIWYSEKAARDWGPNGEDWRDEYEVDRFLNNGNLRNSGDSGDHVENGDGERDREKRWSDGFFVEMPNNGGETHHRRWLRPHRLDFQYDGTPYADSELPDDLVQMEYTELYDRFSEYALGDLFRDARYGDASARTDHRDSEVRPVNGPTADWRMNGTSSGSEFGMCDIAKTRNDILMFTIAFQAGSHAEGVMRACASGNNGTGYYFPASNAQALNDAFSAIAGTVTKLRLTQ